MRKVFLNKFLFTIGLLLFFTLLTQFATPFSMTAKALEVSQAPGNDKEKNNYRLNLKNITIVKGKIFPLPLKVYNLKDNSKVSYKSNDSTIASVNADGFVTANKVGETTVTVTVTDDLGSTDLTSVITVGPPAFSVKLHKSRIILGVDEIDLLKVNLKPFNTAEAAGFSSHDESIATISNGGRVTAVKPGLTYVFAAIEATDIDGSQKFASCMVIVTKPEDATLMNDYFANHPELNLVNGLSAALEEFFNGTSDKESLAASLTSTSLIEALDKFLNEKFDLDDLRKQLEAANSPTNQTQTNQESQVNQANQTSQANPTGSLSQANITNPTK